MILKRGGELKNNRKTGAECEQKAARFLESRGYEIVDKNYYCPHGEIDIIAKEENEIIFVRTPSRGASLAPTGQFTFCACQRFFDFRRLYPQGKAESPL